MSLAIGCDVGGTNTRVALVDVDSGRLVAIRKHPSYVADYKRGLAALADDIRSFGENVPVGVAIAAQLDPGRRRALVAPNLKWQNVRLADDLEKLVKAPVALENDVRGAAYGELRFGALRGVTGTAASVFWGSGIGGALIAAGQVLPGALSIAGEIGHLTYKANGIMCPCGKRGCYEAYVGGHALARRSKMPTRDLFARGGKLASEAIAIMGQHVGNLATLIDPDAIVIGGSIGLETFTELKKAVLPHLLVVRRGKLKLVRAKLGDHAGVLGAAVIAALAASARSSSAFP